MDRPQAHDPDHKVGLLRPGIAARNLDVGVETRSPCSTFGEGTYSSRGHTMRFLSFTRRDESRAPHT
jgi:hypothetical protein